jgi:CBS domain-containing protein
VTPGTALVIGAGTGTDPVGPAGALGRPGSVASIPVESGPVTVTSIGSPPVPPDIEPAIGSGRGSSGTGELVGVVTLSAEAGATGVKRAARPANTVSAMSRRHCPIGTTSRV